MTTILKEDGMDRAQLILAAQAVLDDLQDMAEKIAKMEAEGIMPLLDGIRTAFGPEFADRLSDDSTEALRGALEAIKDTKERISLNVQNMEQIVTGEGPGNDMALGVGMEEPEAEEVIADEPVVDEVPASSEEDLDDVFGSEAPLGRETKESVVDRNINMLRESVNPDRVIMSHVMTQMKSGVQGKVAVVETAEAFGVDAEDVLAIIREYTSK
jgi:cell division protein ZapA (FtsZ GTPase activity inhibitor)